MQTTFYLNIITGISIVLLGIACIGNSLTIARMLERISKLEETVTAPQSK